MAMIYSIQARNNLGPGLHRGGGYGGGTAHINQGNHAQIGGGLANNPHV